MRRSERTAFGINLLGETDRDLVTLFSDGTRRGDRFAGDRWVIGDEGVPILIDAVMALSCRVDAEFEYGSHSLFVGKVADVRLGPGSDALLWRDGGSPGRPILGPNERHRRQVAGKQKNNLMGG